MADLATLQTRLTEAEDALHRMLTGQMTTRLRFSDRETQKFVDGASIEGLRRHIADLKRQIAAVSGRRGPVYIRF